MRDMPLTPEQLRQKYGAKYDELIVPPKPTETPEEYRRRYDELMKQRENCGHLGARGGLCDNCGEYVD